MNMTDLMENFEELIQANNFQKAERMLAKLVEEVPERERNNAFSSPVRLRAEVVDERADEFQLLGAANTMSRRLRNMKYRARIRGGYNGIRIVEEGDSWHQYPFLLKDIVDVISEDYAIYSLSGAGDTLSEMAAVAEFREAIQEHEPHIFMISAGGNDVLGKGAFVNLIREYHDGATADDLLDKARLSKILSTVTDTFSNIFRSALEIRPTLRIMTHGYDYVHPREDGKWIGEPLKQKKIPFALGREIIEIILKEFNHEMEMLAGGFQGSVTHVNLLGVVDRGLPTWHDEIHPKNSGFRRAASAIMKHFERDQTHPRHAEADAQAARRRAASESARPDDEAVSAILGYDLEPDRRRSTRRAGVHKHGPSALDQFLDRARAKQRAKDEQSELDYRDALQNDPTYLTALADINELLEKLDEPDSQERIDNNLEYSTFGRGAFAERIIGSDNLDEFNILSRGNKVGNAVGKVHIRDHATGGNGSGTGFLVGPQLLLTNNHVLRNRRIAGDSLVAFRYQLDAYNMPDDPVFFRLDGDVFFTSSRLDFSLVGVKQVSADGRFELSKFGSVPLLPKTGKALKHDYVSIIQHPGGGYKKVALRDNKVIGPKGDFLYYVTDTKRGSSGSPAFNKIWQVAALHHQTVPDPENPGMFIANRGVRISSICEHVSQAKESGDPDAAEAWHRIQAGLREGMGGEHLEALREAQEVQCRVRKQKSDCFAEVSRDDRLGTCELLSPIDIVHETSTGSWAPERALSVLSDAGYQMILEHETGGPGYYNNVLKQAPTWPGGYSGVTIGIGYDLGYHTLDELNRDWREHLDSNDLSRLGKAIGVRGNAARSLAKSLSDIKIPLETAAEVFDLLTLPKFVELTYNNLPRAALDALHPHCVSALVSLVFNRGASFRKTANRYREMRAILAAMQAKTFSEIPGQIRSMKRLWADMGLNGLLRRRDDEAALFERGLKAMSNSVAEFGFQYGGTDFDEFDVSAEELDHECVSLEPFGAVDEATLPRLSVTDARWVASTKNAPDQWHLPAETADDSFELDAALVKAAIDVGQYDLHFGEHGKVILSLRGCEIVNGASTLEDRLSIQLRATSPDHENFRCLIGVFDTSTDRISLYTGSTVPRRTGMLGYYDRVNFGADRRLCNMLPTGLYEYCVGTHFSVKSGPVEYVLRLGNGPMPADASVVTVLRTRNDLIYGTQDVWDRTTPGDNIHPAFLTSSFSSLGCLTVRGDQDHKKPFTHASGEWVAFRKKAGFHGERYGERYDNLLITGHECASLAALLANGESIEPLVCLRHGSKGQRVSSLQAQLDIAVDGSFGSRTKEALATLQISQLGKATGTWSAEMANLLGMNF